MADINIVGVNLVTGQFHPLTQTNYATDSDGRSLQGASGLQGVTGISSGQTGVLGAQGISGINGTTGIRGTTGILGITGAQFQGVSGLRGVTGVPLQKQGLTGLQGAGNYSLLTSSTTIVITDAYIFGLNSTGGPFTVTLPVYNGTGGNDRFLIFQDETGQADINPVTLQATLPNVFNYESSTYLINRPYQAVEMLSDTGNWMPYSLNMGFTGIQGVTGVSDIWGATGIAGATGI